MRHDSWASWGPSRPWRGGAPPCRLRDVRDEVHGHVRQLSRRPPMSRSRPAVRAASTAVLLALASTACTNALEADSDDGGTVEAWPAVDIAGEATSPVAADIDVRVHDIMRSSDGFTTALIDVENTGNED